MEAKANNYELKRLIADFELHRGEFEDLKTRFGSTVDSQHKLQDNTKEQAATIDHKFKLIDDEMKRNGLDYVNKVKQVRDQMRAFQKEVDLKFVEEANKVQERATYEDIAAVRDEMQKYALITSIRELRREILPEVRKMGTSITAY